MQISQFNGGINTRLAAHLIQTNEAVECSNAVITDGQVTSIKTHKDLNSPIKANLKNFKGKWLSFDEDTTFAHFQGRLFKSNGVDEPMMTFDGYKWYPLGFKAPLKAPKVSAKTGINLTEIVEVSKKVLFSTFDSPKLTNTNNPYITDVIGMDAFASIGYAPYRPTDRLGNPLRLSDPTKILLTMPYILRDVISSQNGIQEGQESQTFIPIYAYATLPESKTFGTINGYMCYAGLLKSVEQPSFIRVFRRGDLAYKVKVFANYYREDTDKEFYKIRVPDAPNFTMTPDAPVFQAEFSQPKEKPPVDKYTKWLPNTTYTYTLLWTNLDTKLVTTEKVSVQSPESFDNLLFWGWKFKDRAGYSVKIYRDGKKCDLVKHGDWWYDNKVTLSESLGQVGREDISYCYTYYSDFLGIESAPSPVTDNLPDDYDLIYLDFEIPEDIKYCVTHIKIYRRGLGTSEMSLVNTIPATKLQYGDILKSNIDGAVLNTFGNLPPIKGLRFITSTISLLFGAKDSTLYYCKSGDYRVWSDTNYINFDDTITGLGLTPNGLLVFTRFKTYIVTGDSPRNFAKFLVSNSIGCRSHKSIQSIRQTLIWLSDDCLCISSGGDIDKFTTKKLSKFESYTPRCSAVFDDVYYLSYAGGVWCIDFKTGGTITHLSQSYLGLAVSENSLFACLDGNLVELFKGEGVETLRYKTPNFADVALSVMKLYKQIYFFCGGSLEVEVFVDGVSVGKYPLVSGFNEVKLPAEKFKGYFISFAFEGKGTLSEIEYKVEGRQNAR